MTRCQICGRRRGTGKGGTILHHHVQGVPCPGAGFPPIEQDDARLESVVAEAAELNRTLALELARLYEARANWIDPALVRRSLDASTTFNRLRRRLDRHRNWPARFARQMETQGWGDPPPDYLLNR